MRADPTAIASAKKLAATLAPDGRVTLSADNRPIAHQLARPRVGHIGLADMNTIRAQFRREIGTVIDQNGDPAILCARNDMAAEFEDMPVGRRHAIA